MFANIEYRVCKHGWHLKGSFVGQSTKYLTGVLCLPSSYVPPHDSAVIIRLNRDETFIKQEHGYMLWRGSDSFPVHSSMTWHDMTWHVHLFLCALDHFHFDPISVPPPWPKDMFMHYQYSTRFYLLLSDNKHNCVDPNISEQYTENIKPTNATNLCVVDKLFYLLTKRRVSAW
jgi:hypothetical protein